MYWVTDLRSVHARLTNPAIKWRKYDSTAKSILQEKLKQDSLAPESHTRNNHLSCWTVVYT